MDRVTQNTGLENTFHLESWEVLIFEHCQLDRGKICSSFAQ